MEISRLFLPLLTELGGWEVHSCYNHVAPNGAPALQCRLFNRASCGLCAPGELHFAEPGRQPRKLSGLGTQAKGLCSLTTQLIPKTFRAA